jgi:hypothetical protein
MSDWTAEQRAEVVSAYQEANPTAETSVEIIKEIAENMERSANSIRMVLIQEGVYVKKDAKASTAKEGKKASSGTGRVSKEDSIAALKQAIEAAGKTVDDDILDKLTGKAAVYFTNLFS